MNLKRIIALVLLIALVMTVMPAFANEETTAVSSFDAEAYKKNVDFITSLEIYSFSDEKADSSVTRAEFAKMIADLLGISADYSSSDYFTDVPSNSPYSGEVGAVASLGIMNGVGGNEFCPDENITYTQAVKTVVSALGYEPMAKLAGGYPDGYLKCAYNIGIIKNAPYDFNAPITFDAAANLIALASEAEVYEMVYLTEKKAYFASREDKVVLNVYHNIYLAEGIMTDNGITSLDGESAVSVDCVKIGDSVLNGADEKDREFLGYYVDYYYRADDNKLLYVMEKKNRNDVITIKADELMTDSTDFSKTCVVMENANGKARKFKLDPYADLIYNGGLDKTFNGESLKIKEGTLKLIDADRDNDYELIIAEEYRDTVFKNLNTENGKIVSTYSETDYAFINYGEYKTAVFQNAMGEEISPESIKTGSVISVFRSKNKEKVRFVVSENVAEIVAETVETDEDGTVKITFGENTYEFSDTYENLIKTNPATFKVPTVSCSYKVFLNYEGNIAMLTETEGRLQYAYMLRAGKTGTGLDSSRVSVKLLLESDDYVTVPVADKLTLDGVKNQKGSDILSSDVFFDTATGEVKPQLVMIRISPDGKLKELDSAIDNRDSVFGFDLENFSLDFVSESGYTANAINGVRPYNGNQIISANTKIFAVDSASKTMEETDEELVHVIDFGTYTRRYGSSYIKLYDADEGWEAGAIVVSEPLDYQSRLFVVTESYVQKDFDGEFKQAINGWWTQDFRSFVESREGIFAEAVKARYPGSDGKIYPGDILEIGFDVDEGINRARMLYSPKRDNDPDYTYFDMNGQSSINDDNNYYILGYPCYISENRIGTYSKENPTYKPIAGNSVGTKELFWTTVLQAPTGSMSIFEYDCETKEVKIISWDKIPAAAQLTAKGYENINPDTKVFVKRVKGTTYDVIVVTNLSSQYN